MREILKADLKASLGEYCEITDDNGKRLKAEVIGVNENSCQLMTYQHAAGLSPGMRVMGHGRPLRIPVGVELIGRTMNGVGQTIDGGAVVPAKRWRSTEASAPQSLTRLRITKPLVTGQRAIDGLLTIGQGQRVGLFAGSGVGKSTLLGEIAKRADADVNVIALVGERGREVLPFIQDSLGIAGKEKSVVVVATSDDTPLMKVQAVKSALAIAEDFRDQGANVLFFFDSLTRFANAQKEIGLSRGEVPGLRGFPASVQSMMAALLERLGNDDRGSITGLITVLVDGDDMNEPVADAARSILDGHIVLDRKLAAMGHYPAIDVLNSLSRLYREITNEAQQNSSRALRQILATHEDAAELIQVGLYQKGTSTAIDHAIEKLPGVKGFLAQEVGEFSSFEQSIAALQALCP